MPLARQIGQRVHARRLGLGLTQQQLANQLGVSPQQVGRYESGEDHISSPRLYQIATVLVVSPGNLYPPVQDGAGADTNVNGVVTTFLNDPYAIRLLRAFATVRGKKLRAQVVDWVEAFASHHMTNFPQPATNK